MIRTWERRVERTAMALASRLDLLGTETAFAVSLAAAEWAAQGNRVFPFHLGDINLSTPSNIVDAMNRAVADGKTGYCAAAGIPALRAALADNIGGDRGMSLGPENIVVQTGGKPVITKFVQSVVNPGDGVLFPTPGYPIYESQVEYYGGLALPYRYVETASGFAIDLDHVRELAPRATALVYNNLQNPLGCESSEEEMQAIADLAIEHDLWVLSDEAYFEMRYAGESTSIASLPGMAERTVILYTFSKKFAMTGWRLGCAAAPVELAQMIAKLNTNDESCTTHFVQEAGIEALRDPSGTAPILAELQARRDAAAAAIAIIPGVSCATPDSTFYLFANVTEAMQMTGFDEVSDFATAALHETGVSVCTRRHFGRPQPGETQQYIRFAYSGISVADIAEGLGKMSDWIGSAS
jgi:aspartate/methionine/tyrosine aminotransferase